MADTLGEIQKMGYLKVRRKEEKKFKKRWAVLRQDTASVDIYESDKKWRARDKCKIVSKKEEPKCKYAIGLMGTVSYTLGLDSDEEQTDWLLRLRWVHQGGRHADAEPPRPHYDSMWEVTITDRGLGSTKKLNGQYCVGLTCDGIQLINKRNNNETYDLPFSVIRGCRHMECFFWLEVGRTSCFGAGEIYMQLAERIYAQNMHEVMKTKFNSRSSESSSQQGESRPRVASTSEPSRPINVAKGRRNTYSSNNSSHTSVNTIPAATTPGRDRSGSVPSRPRTTSEGTGDRHHATLHGHHTRSRVGTDSHSRISLVAHSRSSSMTAGSPPVPSSSFSPASVDSSSSYSIDEHGSVCHPITSENTIVEEAAGDYLMVDRGRASAEPQDVTGGRKRSLPPLSLPLAPAGSASAGPPSADSPYLPMVISPGRQPAPAGAEEAPAYLPMVIAPGGGGDTPDGYITSPTPSQGHRGHHSRDSSLTEDSYVPMFPQSEHGDYLDMRVGGGSASHLSDAELSYSGADPEGYVPFAPGHPHFAGEAVSPSMDVHPAGKRASKISDADSYVEVSPGSSCSLLSGTPQSESAHLDRAAPLTVLTPPSEDAQPTGRHAAASAADRQHASRSDGESTRMRAFSLGSRLSQALKPRRRDRSESDSNSTERPSTGEPGVHSSSGAVSGSPHLSSSLDSPLTPLKEYCRRRQKGTELREQTGSPAAESHCSQDSLRHRPRSNSQSSQGSDKTHSNGWRMLFKRRDKKSTGSLPVDVPAQRAPRSPNHPPPCAEETYVGVAMGAPARAGGGTRRRHRPKRRDAQPHYTDDDYLMMGPMHLDEDTSSGSQAGSLKRRTPAVRRAPTTENDSYMSMEPVRPLGSPLASPAGGDYLNMDMSLRRAPPTAAPTSDYVNMEISGGVPGPMPPPAADTSDYLAMTPRSLATPPGVPAAAPAAAATAGSDGDYLEMSLGSRPTPAMPVMRSRSARSSAEREPERWPAGSRRDPDAYCAMEAPRRPVSALLSVQTSLDGGDTERRKSDTTSPDDRRRSMGSGFSPGPGSGSGAKVQRKNSGVTGAGLLRKLDAMNPRAMFRTLSQRGKKDSKRLSPGAAEGGAAPTSIDRSPSSQSLSSSNSIQEEVEVGAGADCEPLTSSGVPVFRAAEPAPESRLSSASPCGSVASVTPRASLASSQATTPRQTPAPTPTPTPLPLTTSSSLTSFAPAAAAAAAPAVRQRHESNPPPCSQSRQQRPQTSCGSRSLTALPTEEPEVVYASLDLVDGDTAACQAQLAAASKLTYAKIDFKETGKLKQRDS
ncbi:Insulin receptor substrate 1 [Amphibalanus amphitrite]|uniref:Insulin receptor substrate 1 n=1 Tax=Amphibalanus amphitrite TaxID=1232801 RepID=A0A6A4V9V6_AMPAM|nr:Insulin receptor substrate 1 [Amphibalanus amphitrite]KAF0290443.1 Insulin receptor substrate 1 [Amphibalanus amphitrite]